MLLLRRTGFWVLFSLVIVACAPPRTASRRLALPSGAVIEVVNVDTVTRVATGERSLGVRFKIVHAPLGDTFAPELKEIAAEFAPEAKSRGLTVIGLTPLVEPEPRIWIPGFPQKVRNSTFELRQSRSGDWLPTWKEFKSGTAP